MKIHCADNDELSQIPNHKREKDKHNKEKPSEIAVEKSNAYSSKIKASGTFTTGEHQLTVHEYDSNPPKIHIPKSSMDPSTDITSAHNAARRVSRQKKDDHHKHNIENPSEIAVENSNTYSIGTKASGAFTTDERPLTAHECDSDLPTIHIPNSSIDPSTDIPYLYNASRRVNRKTKGAHHKHNTENPSEITAETSSTYSRRTELGAAFTTHVHQSATREYDSELPSIRVPNSVRYSSCAFTFFSTLYLFFKRNSLMAHQPVMLLSTTLTERRKATTEVSNANMVINGNGEAGACAVYSEVSSPPGWMNSRNITQIYYNTTFLFNGAPTLSGTEAETTDRGSCFFYGYDASSVSIWQTINLTDYADTGLIDSGSINFNLSSWLGGVSGQEDGVVVSLTFADKNNQTIGNMSIIGPVSDADRGGQTILLFRQFTGIVPIGARTATVFVTFTRYFGTYLNGYADNIGVYLYQ
ncbi:unnamed protein product [Rotaria socialis]|uniref:Uncharacterized protein n=1 Tax=Rotaria socialis TaxID=392032 RepID=A0A817PXP9_9BILA|nr:unnamed protein product [Rotaria socialis]